jgi:hypothetical protein
VGALPAVGLLQYIGSVSEAGPPQRPSSRIQGFGQGYHTGCLCGRLRHRALCPHHGRGRCLQKYIA